MSELTKLTTWAEVTGMVSVEAYVRNALGPFENLYLIEDLTTDFLWAIRDRLPSQVRLIGDQFIGPAELVPLDSEEFTLSDRLSFLVEDIDFWTLAKRHEIPF